jgi:uncharacterized membrane protein YhaH (DUF805 family)
MTTDFSSLLILAQSDAGGGPGLLGFLIRLVLFIAMICGMWKVFEKADKHGWAALIPIYNFIVLFQIIGRPWWWVLLLFIPLVNIVVYIIVKINLAKSYDKGVLFGLGLAFLPFIFYPILGFGNATYKGPSVTAG